MPVTQSLLVRTLLQGTVYTNKMAWTAGANSVLLAGDLSTADLQNAQKRLTLVIEESTDGGQSFHQAASTDWTGGQLDKDGTTPLVPKIIADYTNAGTKPDFIRGRLELPQILSIGVSGTI